MRSPILNQRFRTIRGFTLIELMVTVGIFVFMTALILARYSGYNSGTLLTNLAYDVALSIRHAQTFGLSVVTTGGSNFSAAYGVEFSSTAGSNTKYVLFSDINSDRNYDEGTDGRESLYNLKQGAVISGLCVGNGSSCSAANNAASLDVFFLRPDPAAIICANASCTWTYAQITVASRDGSTRIVKVNKVGQINVGN